MKIFWAAFPPSVPAIFPQAKSKLKNELHSGRDANIQRFIHSEHKLENGFEP